MKVRDAIEGAVTNLTRHKLRTSLTMLGMIFGVGAVIAMLAIGGGAEKSTLEAIDRLGVRNIIVRGAKIKSDELAELRKKSLGVSLRDAEAVMESVPGVEAVLPRIEVKVYKAMSIEGKSKAKLFGVSWKLPAVTRLSVAEGRFFQRDEEEKHAQVCVLGEGVRRELFGFGPAIGKLVKVNDVWLEVIGVLASPTLRGGAMSSNLPTASPAHQILIPYTTAARKFERDPLEAPVDELTIRLKEGTASPEAAALVRPLIDRLHGGADDYEIVVPEELLAQSRRTQRMFNVVMGSIAGISLLVGGIGIMNIMLASVLERTREIGVRRALGARSRDILLQFLTEAVLLAAIGGVAGIIIGFVLAQFVAAFAGWPTVVSVWSIVLSTGVSMGVGWGAGMYPATRAAALNPIEALRYE